MVARKPPAGKTKNGTKKQVRAASRGDAKKTAASASSRGGKKAATKADDDVVMMEDAPGGSVPAKPIPNASTSSAGGIFGSANLPAPSSQASSIFGAAAAPPLSQPHSIFGAAPASQPLASQQSIFGSAVPAASQSPKGGIFGAASGAAGSKSPKSTIFGASGGDAAGAATSASNIFGTSATAATSSTNIFGPKAGSSQSEDPVGAAANIFGVAPPVASASASAIESAPASTNIFGVAPSVDMTKPLPAVPEEETLEMDEGRSSPNKTDGPQQDQADDKAKPTAEDDEAMNNETKKVEDAVATSAAASSPKSKMAQYICDNIREVYRKKNPKKIKTLTSLLEKYKGREMQLYKKVCAQYELPVDKTEADGTKKIIWYAVTDIDDTAEFKDEEAEGGDKGGTDAPASMSSTAAPAAPTTSIFGSTTGAAAGASIFGAKPAGGTSLFGAPAGTSTGAAAPSIFGAPGTSSGSLFGAPPASSGGLFGAPAGDAVKASEPKGIFGAATTTSGDGNATAPALGGIFGSSASSAAAPTSIFGSATTAPGAGDAKSAAASIFGVPSGVTGPPAATTTTSSTSSNANGGGGMKRTSSIFGADAAVDDGLDQKAKIASIFGSAEPVKDVDEKTASKEIKLPGAGSKRKSIFEATSKNAGIFAPNPENSIFGKAPSGVLAEGESLFGGALSGGSSGKNKKLSVSESKTGASVGGNAGIFGSLPQPTASTGGFNNIFSNTGSKSIFGNGKNAFGGATAKERFGENLDGDTPPLEPFADANAAPAANPGTPVAAPTRKKRARDDAMDDEPAGGSNVAAVPGARRAKRAAAVEEPSSMAQGEESAPNPFKNVDFGGGAKK